MALPATIEISEARFLELIQCEKRVNAAIEEGLADLRESEKRAWEAVGRAKTVAEQYRDAYVRSSGEKTCDHPLPWINGGK